MVSRACFVPGVSVMRRTLPLRRLGMWRLSGNRPSLRSPCSSLQRGFGIWHAKAGSLGTASAEPSKVGAGEVWQIPISQPWQTGYARQQYVRPFAHNACSTCSIRPVERPQDLLPHCLGIWFFEQPRRGVSP